MTTFATLQTFGGGDAFDGAGNLYVASIGGNTITKITPGGTATVFASGLDEPTGVAVDASGNVYVANNGNGFGLTVTRIAPDGTKSTYATGLQAPSGLALDAYGNLYVSNNATHGGGTITEITPAGAKGTFATGLTNSNGLVFSAFHPFIFNGEVALGQGVYYLAFPGNGNIFGYYEYLSDPHYIYHFDLGYEYGFDLGNGGVVFYDFKSNDYFYTGSTFPFPYLYDFALKAFLYYYPDPTNPQRYNTNGVRYFYNFSTGKVISK